MGTDMRIREHQYRSSLSYTHLAHRHVPQNPSHPLLRSDSVFKLYLTALRDLGLESSIPAAVRRRDALLTAPALIATTDTAALTGTVASGLEAHAPSSEASSTTTSETSTGIPSTPTSAPSPSQQAAQEVLSKATVVRSVNTDFDALGAALGRGAGVPGNPIVVTLNERE